MLGGAILLGSAAFVHWGVRLPAHLERTRRELPPARVGDLVIPVALVLAVSNQLFFLTAVLPEVLPGLGVAPERVVEVGGLLVFVSAVAAGLGALATPRLAARLPEGTLIAALLVCSGLLMGAMALRVPPGGTRRSGSAQVLFAAPIFPLVVARTAQQGSGGAIGVINSARIGGSFIRARARHHDPLGVVAGGALRDARPGLPGCACRSPEAVVRSGRRGLQGAGTPDRR